MLILGVDTSCDDTSASLLRADGTDIEVLSNIVSSQSEIHTKYGGIVPELASRSHMEMIWPVVKEALGGHGIEEVDAAAVCMGPGLIGSLLVGCSFIKAMCYARDIPLVAVNHLEGHLLSAFLTGTKPEFPFLTLIVSGGHTSLYKVNGYCDYEEIGRTRDDAAGEAYDKVAKLLDLGYPGGPVIDNLAAKGDPKVAGLPRPYLPDSMDFSFSGLKTAVRLMHEKRGDLSNEDMAAGFQASVVDVLVRKVKRAIKEFGVSRVSITGGVAANSELRKRMAAMCKGLKADFYLPPLEYCTDNAAMIALAGYHRYQKGEIASMELNPKAHMHL
ncbi:MAG: tRNA (adenosine(37)-N6)-threonylcarbamoyltransferase complex transferase subunit TsaD [Thermodesulfovibrionales bacterium]|nr:tRNA (adenosine(37)-N6)-threonylcarbamoyltransferase complex transferase subunit TsaD [Thermodesulfovibrionales bacterium]